MHDETELLARLRAGDRHAFTKLVEQHSARIYRLALRMMEDPAEAEEVLQETFLQVVRHIDNFRGQSRLSTWLFRIASNQALMKLRRKRPLSVPLEAIDASFLSEMPAPMVDWSNRPESELLNREAQEEMEGAIRAIPENLRVVFILRDVEGLTTAETAAALGLSLSAVKSRLLRARLKLRDRLSSYFAERKRD